MAFFRSGGIRIALVMLAVLVAWSGRRCAGDLPAPDPRPSRFSQSRRLPPAGRKRSLRPQRKARSASSTHRQRRLVRDRRDAAPRPGRLRGGRGRLPSSSTRASTYSAILRAAIANLREGGIAQGASTITQQMVKSLLLTPERTYKRKMREIILSRQHRAAVHQGRDPLPLSESDLFRQRRLGRRPGGAQLFRQGGPGSSRISEAAMLAGPRSATERRTTPPGIPEVRRGAPALRAGPHARRRTTSIEATYDDRDSRTPPVIQRPSRIARTFARRRITSPKRSAAVLFDRLEGDHRPERTACGSRRRIDIDSAARRPRGRSRGRTRSPRSSSRISRRDFGGCPLSRSTRSSAKNSSGWMNRDSFDFRGRSRSPRASRRRRPRLPRATPPPIPQTDPAAADCDGFWPTARLVAAGSSAEGDASDALRGRGQRARGARIRLFAAASTMTSSQGSSSRSLAEAQSARIGFGFGCRGRGPPRRCGLGPQARPEGRDRDPVKKITIDLRGG